jgi:hypothetical protein
MQLQEKEVRQPPHDLVEKGRLTTGPFDSPRGAMYGATFVTPPNGEPLKVIFCDGTEWDGMGMPPPPWDHVSVSCRNRVPTWEEMCWVKRLFFNDNECVVQYHPAEKDYVNEHPNVLHLWRLVGQDFPMPPKQCV